MHLVKLTALLGATAVAVGAPAPSLVAAPAPLAVASAPLAVASAPLAVASALRPAFTAEICSAKPPRLAHGWVAGVVPASASAISNEDHADLLFKLGLLQGHLMVGRELLDAGQPGLALPHFGHPVRELYDDISPELARRGVTGFDQELIALEAVAAGGARSPAMDRQYAKVQSVVSALRATVPAPLLDNERFMLGVLGEVAAVSAEDYSEALEGGRIEKPVEYHDSRGYLQYAAAEMDRMEALQPSPRLAAARAKLREMQAVTGSLLPPERPVLPVAAYKAIAEQFKQAAGA